MWQQWLRERDAEAASEPKHIERAMAARAAADAAVDLMLQKRQQGNGLLKREETRAAATVTWDGAPKQSADQLLASPPVLPAPGDDAPRRAAASTIVQRRWRGVACRTAARYKDGRETPPPSEPAAATAVPDDSASSLANVVSRFGLAVSAATTIQRCVRKHRRLLVLGKRPEPTAVSKATDVVLTTPLTPCAAGDGTPFTLANLARFSPTIQKNIIGERLYRLIHPSQPELAGKLTGMLLGLDNADLLVLLESPKDLRSKLDEALALLQQHGHATPRSTERAAAGADRLLGQARYAPPSSPTSLSSKVDEPPDKLPAESQSDYMTRKVRDRRGNVARMCDPSARAGAAPGREAQS